MGLSPWENTLLHGDILPITLTNMDSLEKLVFEKFMFCYAYLLRIDTHLNVLTKLYKCGAENEGLCFHKMKVQLYRRLGVHMRIWSRIEVQTYWKIIFLFLIFTFSSHSSSLQLIFFTSIYAETNPIDVEWWRRVRGDVCAAMASYGDN